MQRLNSLMLSGIRSSPSVTCAHGFKGVAAASLQQVQDKFTGTPYSNECLRPSSNAELYMCRTWRDLAKNDSFFSFALGSAHVKFDV